ncbi:hypothetical protein ABEB36_015036 [Hypothenemus hampei]|uniref:Uncharacterized protein n=1 Tax=Hypothenemus hampei TaxID=57062 RepID=A0ABD1E1M0_HYPHA
MGEKRDGINRVSGGIPPALPESPYSGHFRQWPGQKGRSPWVAQTPKTSQGPPLTRQEYNTLVRRICDNSYSLHKIVEQQYNPKRDLKEATSSLASMTKKIKNQPNLDLTDDKTVNDEDKQRDITNINGENKIDKMMARFKKQIDGANKKMEEIHQRWPRNIYKTTKKEDLISEGENHKIFFLDGTGENDRDTLNRGRAFFIVGIKQNAIDYGRLYEHWEKIKVHKQSLKGIVEVECGTTTEEKVRKILEYLFHDSEYEIHIISGTAQKLGGSTSRQNTLIIKREENNTDFGAFGHRLTQDINGDIKTKVFTKVRQTTTNLKMEIETKTKCKTDLRDRGVKRGAGWGK